MSSINSSAISDYNTAVVKQSGRVGTVRYYTKNGQTYVRAASNSHVTNTRTNAQMTQRLLFASLGALYSAFGTHLKGAFPQKARNQSDYNVFMQVNQGSGVYMTKQARALGQSVALPVIVASGKLTEVGATIQDGKLVSNLSIANLDLSTAKVSDLSKALVGNNEEWQYGDQLTIVLARQDGDYCHPKYVRMVLSETDSTLVSAYGTFSAESNCLAYAVSGDLCAGFIHSSTDGQMSLCRLVPTESMANLIEAYLADDVFALAAASYGTAKETFLVPTDTGTSSVNKKKLVLSVSPSDAGTVTGAGSYDAGTTVTITATPNSGYQFLRWSDGNTTATRQLTINANMSLIAVFSENS